MANKYKVIDEKTWNRAMHCMIFRNSVEPAFCVTFEADITRFKRVVKEQGEMITSAVRLIFQPSSIIQLFYKINFVLKYYLLLASFVLLWVVLEVLH